MQNLNRIHEIFLEKTRVQRYMQRGSDGGVGGGGGGFGSDTKTYSSTFYVEDNYTSIFRIYIIYLKSYIFETSYIIEEIYLIIQDTYILITRNNSNLIILYMCILIHFECSFKEPYSVHNTCALKFLCCTAKI